MLKVKAAISKSKGYIREYIQEKKSLKRHKGTKARKGEIMRNILISDETMKRATSMKELTLSFKEKLELAKLLDSLNVSVIEIEGIEKAKADTLRIKSIASIVKNSTLAVPVKIDGSDIEETWNALTETPSPRLQVEFATSPARMEYVHKMKAPDAINVVANTVKACAAYAADVEFIAEDATRTDSDYLAEIINAAIDAGATTITVCDDAGIMLPDEFGNFIAGVIKAVPKLTEDIALGIRCSNELFMSVSTSIAGIVEGVTEVKVTTYPLGETLLPKLVKVLTSKGDSYDVSCSVNTTALQRTMGQIERICNPTTNTTSHFASLNSNDAENDMVLKASDDKASVIEAVSKLGYDLSQEDAQLVYEEFQRIAAKKESLNARELDAIVASSALQVPSTYKLDRYTINSGNAIKATASIRMIVGDNYVEKVAMGDGPIDAAFAAIDLIVGKAFELDDWQMQSVTEGQEAMGECIVKLISEGKIYSGRGLSTDIVGSSIRAYINALNKVVYEEEN